MNLKRLLRDAAARVLAPAVSRLAPDPRYFDLWQTHGFHVSQVHYYQPVPDTRSLTTSLWTRMSPLSGLDMREKEQLELLDAFCCAYKDEYSEFPRGRPSE